MLPLLMAVCALATQPGAGLPSDAEIRELLRDRVETLAGREDGVGIVVGVIGTQGRRIISYGHLGQGDRRSMDGDTGFEIGSVTKVFTALVLADMVQRHEVALEDPVANYLPAARIPERNGRPITLVDLATHTSGLPFMPDVEEAAATNGGSAPLYRFLAGYPLPRDSGAEWDYSNLGYWLLAQALTARAGTDYESLLRARVIAPLKMTRTALIPSSTLRMRLAVGHDAVLQPALAFSATPLSAQMAAAGGLVSTANDLLAMLAATLGYERSPLAPAMAAMLETRRPLQRGEAQALGWVVSERDGAPLIVHDGGTWGYASSVAWDPGQRVGIVVLSNQVASVGDIARHLLRPSLPLERPTATKRTEIALAATVLDACAGRYEAEGEGAFIVSLDGGALTIRLPPDWGLPKMRLHPESSRDFFASELPLRVTFETDPAGRVSAMLVHPPRGQHAIRASRMNDRQ